MTDFYILNEVAPGTAPTNLGAIKIFASADSLTQYVEPWFVDETYLLLSSSGRRHSLVSDGEQLSIVPHEDETDYAILLKTLLVDHLSAVEQAIKARKKVRDIDGLNFARFDIDALLKIALLCD